MDAEAKITTPPIIHKLVETFEWFGFVSFEQERDGIAPRRCQSLQPRQATLPQHD